MSTLVGVWLLKPGYSASTNTLDVSGAREFQSKGPGTSPTLHMMVLRCRLRSSRAYWAALLPTFEFSCQHARHASSDVSMRAIDAMQAGSMC